MYQDGSHVLYSPMVTRHVLTLMNFTSLLYISVLCTLTPVVSSIPYNPVSMTDSNKAKEYGLGAAALACSTLSVLASTVCMYWFCRLQKRFRHRLVMILIYGDLMRGVWLFVFSIISLARGTVSTHSSFCQVSGFLVQYGTQTSDYAVFVMAIHSAVQVFYPSTLVSSDGLYPWRRWVYVGAFVLPILMSALAFVNVPDAYVSQGAYCSLPIRPFWYRLALTWIPRYIIVLTIIGLAIAIYTHVGFSFRVYARSESSFQSLKAFKGSTLSPVETQDEAKMEDITFELTNMESRPRPERRKSSIGHDILTVERRLSSSIPVSPSSSNAPQRVSFDSGSMNMNQSLPGSSSFDLFRRADLRPALLSIPSGRSMLDPISPLDQIAPRAQPLTSINTPSTPSSRPRAPSPTPTECHLTQQRRRIHRQLRLMFIYPLVYTLMWLIPFAMHCMNYWDRYARSPVEFLRVGSSICITLIGFIDALIFSLREKPWRGIMTSDGTFWGSFVVARRGLGDVQVDAMGNEITHDASISGSAGAKGRARGSQSYRASASGDYARAAAEQARARLELEREERFKALGERARRESLSGWEEGQRGLNVGDGRLGQIYDDNGLEDDTVESPYNSAKKELA